MYYTTTPPRVLTYEALQDLDHQQSERSKEPGRLGSPKCEATIPSSSPYFPARGSEFAVNWALYGSSYRKDYSVFVVHKGDPYTVISLDL